MDYDDQITARVSSTTVEDVESLAKRRGERKSETIRSALEAGLEELKERDAPAKTA